MAGRVKFQVWSKRKQAWRTAYVHVELLGRNINQFTDYGFKVRGDFNGIRFSSKQAA